MPAADELSQEQTLLLRFRAVQHRLRATVSIVFQSDQNAVRILSEFIKILKIEGILNILEKAL